MASNNCGTVPVKVPVSEWVGECTRRLIEERQASSQVEWAERRSVRLRRLIGRPGASERKVSDAGTRTTEKRGGKLTVAKIAFFSGEW